MKTFFAVPGAAPRWLHDQVRYTAQQLTTLGRVTVGFTDRTVHTPEIPGQVSDSIPLGIGPTGYPVWTGRTASVLGLRRRTDNVIIYLFDGVRFGVALMVALVSMLRREHVVIHDFSEGKVRATPFGRLAKRLLRRFPSPPVTIRDNQASPAVAVAFCDGDLEFARLMVSAASAMPAETAKRWRLVLQSGSIDNLEPVVAEGLRRDIVSWAADDIEALCAMSDVVIVRDGGMYADLATQAVLRGAAAVLVGHRIASRIARRVDGVWLAEEDVPSVLAALDSARGMGTALTKPAAEIRVDGDRLIDLVRTRELAAA